ncbi:hypothetical protein [Acidovorax sp. SUPP3334]|uniref:hypothetical protein n=1 Tax=Acidovorax sp. SUPP3334 TaxID=2920881 RepID=UPI0023DE55D5|nr:hypothetical protein [Acidovorax sp. SUPP3334]GKT24971.1 hypothetical protein AVHM3334_16445 [Acidovorax sp. SUPP3334]
MILDAPTAHRFIDAYTDYLLTLLKPKEKRGAHIIEQLVLGRQRHADDPGLLDGYRAAHPQADAEMLDAIAGMQVGQWLHLKDTRTYSVVMDVNATSAYAVLGLTQRLRDINANDGEALGSGRVMTAALVPIQGRWVCDGLITNPVWIGPNYRRDYTARYQKLRQDGHFRAHP